jgi:outer membrane protein TolC
MKGYLLILVLLMLMGIGLNAQNNNLQYYLVRALNNSPLLKDYQNQVLSNQLDSQRILAGYRPQVTGSSINMYAPVFGGYGYDLAISNGGNFTTVVGVDKTWVSKKNLSTQFGAINLQNQAINNNSRISEQELKRTIVGQYITAFGDMLQLDFNKSVHELLQKEEGILKELTQKNIYRQADYLSFLVTLQQQTIQYKQLQIQFKYDYAALNYLSGIQDTSTSLLEDPQIELVPLPELTHSVFLRQFAIDSLKLTNNKKILEYNYKPKAHLFADAGYSSSLAFQPYKNFGTSFGFSVTVPIYDGHVKRLLSSKIDIAERTRTAYQSFFTSQYQQQIAQLTQQLIATEELINQIKDQIRYSESLIDVNGKLLETGDVRIADYIIALGNYLNAKNMLTQNNIMRLQIINQINYWNR